MHTKRKIKTVYYSDEINDDFSKISVKNSIKIDENYKYNNHGLLWRIGEFVIYRIVAIPIVYLFCKVRFKVKIKNKKVIKPYRKSGFCMYGNHTQAAADAFIPNLVSFPKKSFIIVNPDAVSIKGLRSIVKMLGAIPVASNIGAAKNFANAIEERYNEGNCIVIYPEAHIWPYYTDIRPFVSNSFRYPAKLNSPVFCFTNTYQKRKFHKRPKITVYVDGPFFIDEGKSFKENEKLLRDCVYNAMKQNAEKYSDYCYINYQKNTDGVIGGMEVGIQDECDENT